MEVSNRDVRQDVELVSDRDTSDGKKVKKVCNVLSLFLVLLRFFLEALWGFLHRFIMSVPAGLRGLAQLP